jgi:hypothetical protein
MLSCLETRWLKAPKWLPAPTIVVATELTNADGFYAPPPLGDVFDHGGCFEKAKGTGLIVLAACANEEVLAHEFRHHWQWHCGVPFDHVPFNPDKDYREAVVEFFLKSYTESDALRYELKKVPKSPVVNVWLDWIKTHVATVVHKL